VRFALRTAVFAISRKNFTASPTGAWRGPVNSNQVPEDHGTAPCNVTTAIIGLRKALCPLRCDSRGDFDMGAL